MRLFKKLFLFLVGLQAAFLVCALILKRRYAAQQLGVDQVNVVGILGGAEETSASQAFKGGYVRAMLGGVELDLSNAAIETPPVTIEATVIMGGAEIKVPRDWTVAIKANATMGGIEDTKTQDSSDDHAPDLIITGTVLMGGLAIVDESGSRFGQGAR